jgi:fumarate reductase subunit C
MNPPAHTNWHPKWYRKHISTYWWMKRGVYLRFILRELSSVFIAYYVVVTLFQIAALSRDERAYQDWQAYMKSPLGLILNGISLFFVVFHSITWFNLAPKAMVAHFRGKKVPAAWVAAGNYGLWVGASIVVALVILMNRGR